MMAYSCRCFCGLFPGFPFEDAKRQFITIPYDGEPWLEIWLVGTGHSSNLVASESPSTETEILMLQISPLQHGWWWCRTPLEPGVSLLLINHLYARFRADGSHSTIPICSSQLIVFSKQRKSLFHQLGIEDYLPLHMASLSQSTTWSLSVASLVPGAPDHARQEDATRKHRDVVILMAAQGIWRKNVDVKGWRRILARESMSNELRKRSRWYLL